ncbi:hypothetical protein DA718_11845 [Klebsiella huaxiensis]|nr:hypothetical protein DA718_11845 [Klebsiella huaxiensis]
MALAAIRKRNYRHFMSLFAVVPHTKEHIQNNIIIIINKFRPSSRFTLRNMSTTVYRIEPTCSRL